ncbi:magnesium-protoporphyrin IX monomethyl ester anaerobic oxidative cyclase [Diaphorobacter sp. HDW4A]|uniref:magnesium-protoporphyrin IX monomethyl ester anaerobic oxidative cyclase n=1 Tax=Diaphorobacter sp. HDW4A TaxID=2714924 RepID=UPI001409C16D|nr:magnesium-protoporphyrin IX monomethyl ester anaerobic oxidative cyclase [Diaphorobacter sp. HDW4A]QIL81098.1 magnesium-protoporphyrin IX monomethyl ester anaerobic oxidative cyclase [Diaphorobacter sp. HDW4A]
MKIVLINPPHTAIGSRMPKEHLPPLGLLSIGGPLIDAGFEVALIDAEFGPMPLASIVDQVMGHAADVVMLGHSGSSSAHATVVELCVLLKQRQPALTIIYGGVHPTYLWDEILRDCAPIDFIVRGEGEQTALSLMQALAGIDEVDLHALPGIAFRDDGIPVATADAPMIRRLDDYRVGWELIDHSRYSYWGGKRAVVAQFSRGCPHLCSYCGQRGFWTQWRHRDPVLFAKELARLHREHGVELINFADELPTGSRAMWKAFLEALIAEDVPLLLVGSTRAGDIVRDHDILHLYKKAGVIRFLLGIESYSDATLASIRKGATTSEDQQAITLLREHGMLSMATYVVGFSEEGDADFWRSFRHLVRYDADQIQLLYATPHRWTPFYAEVEDREVLQTDTRRWDYKHQVLANPRVPAWRVFIWFKLIEVIVQLRPRVLARTLLHPAPEYRHAMRWYTRIGRRVWFHEVWEFLTRTRHDHSGTTLRTFAGADLAEREYALARRTPMAPRKVQWITIDNFMRTP